MQGLERLIRLRLAIAISAVAMGGWAHGADEVIPPPAFYYVNAATGDDANDGRSADKAFRSIQHAADLAAAGDTVRVGPGVYFEHVMMKRFGTAAQPVTFRSEQGPSKTIISGADPAIREKKVAWKIEDEALSLYSIPYSWDLDYPPTRVLYDGIDLFPYETVDCLRNFTLHATNDYQSDPGPRHGFSWDAKAKRVYVRLHPSGKYGSLDPNQHTMCVGTRTPALFDIQSPDEEVAVPAHIVIDGFQFETPFRSGVQTTASDVTVRNCRFIGCRGGVAGRYGGNVPNVAIHHCEYSQDAVYDDGLETLKVNGSFWCRKGKIYETGIALDIGADWDIHHNYIHDSFEGLSAAGTRISRNLKVHENVFERLLDNAIETEDHSVNMAIYRNVIRDAFVPISWQPLKGKPWPGPVYCYQNVIYASEAHASLFAFRSPYVFKIGAVKAKEDYGQEYVPEVADPGLLFFNNTIFWERGCLFWDAVWGSNPDKVKLVNNILVTELNFPPNFPKRWPFLTFENNLCVLPTLPALAGQMVEGGQPLGLKDPAKREFEPVGGERIIGKGKAVPGTEFRFRDIGAVQQGDTWYPLTNVGCDK